MSNWGVKEVAAGVVFTALVAGGVVGALRWQLGSAAGIGTEGRSHPPLAAGPGGYIALPPWPAPESLPWVGEEGVDAYGYPLRRVDPIGLQALLRLRRFDELERYLGEIRAAYAADPRKERWLSDAFDAFNSSDPRLLPALTEWMETHPESAGPCLARGIHRRAVAWRHRGGGFIQSVSAGQRTSFAALLAEARTDMEASVSRDPQNVQAWIMLYTTAAEQGDRTGAASSMTRAKVECPLCLVPYETEMRFLAPRWGGSHEAMEDLARSAQVRAADNPALVLLNGFADADRCQVATTARAFDAALAACNRAVATGTHPYFLGRRAQLYVAMERYPDALTDAEAVLRLKPRSEMGLQESYTALMALDQPERAAEALMAHVYCDPGGGTAASLASHASQSLTAIAHGLEGSHRTRALRLLDLALTFEPGNPHAARMHAWWIRYLVRPDNPARQTVEQAAARAALEPESFEAQRDYDAALYFALRRSEIVAVWDAYIARHPEDGRAYRERSGAHHNLGNLAAYRADAERGCELGDGVACRYAIR